MKNVFLIMLLSIIANVAHTQNIFFGEKVQIVGQFNGYASMPYNTDYRTMNYKRMTVTAAAGNPQDGRGAWRTTINVQAAGGDVLPINMTSGAGNGFIFISGPQPSMMFPNSPFDNKWTFLGNGSGAVDGINTGLAWNTGVDMGLNMTTPGHYTFVFNDWGYSGNTNVAYYVGRTSNAPITVTQRNIVTYPDRTADINILVSAAPSMEEKVYVRYKLANSDFGTDIAQTVEAVPNGTFFTATIPAQPVLSDVYYYIFTSTRDLVDLNTRNINAASAPLQVNLAAINFDDNNGANYMYNTLAMLPLTITNFTADAVVNGTKINWATKSEVGNAGYVLQKSFDGTRFVDIAEFGIVPQHNGTYTYSYLDAAATNSFQYYRLKLKELNSNIKYSKILTIKKANKNNIELISANPGTIFDVKTTANNSGQIFIYNEVGKFVKKQFVPKGVSITQVDMSNQATGVYVMQYITADKTYSSSLKLVVQ